jgi:hypothetical protein
MFYFLNLIKDFTIFVLTFIILINVISVYTL